jgi:tetratricopeptide (TPR) repeat protein
MTLLATTPVTGISYFYPQPHATVEARDGFVQLAYGDVPIPLLEEDLASLDTGASPTYDMIGRGIYHTLRANPDCLHATRYGELLQQGYPHFISELGSLIIMLDRKDVDAPYLDRKINYLKIFALLEPANAQFPREIGLTYLEKGVRLVALDQISRSLFLAEEFLLKAMQLGSADPKTRAAMAEAHYLLGRYERASTLWEALQEDLTTEEREKLQQRLAALHAGVVPLVPVVDYLEAVAVAFSAFEREDYDEANAILQDVVADQAFRDGFPMAEIWYLLGQCAANMAQPRLAAEYYQTAIRIRPDFTEALRALNEL